MIEITLIANIRLISSFLKLASFFANSFFNLIIYSRQKSKASEYSKILLFSSCKVSFHDSINKILNFFSKSNSKFDKPIKNKIILNFYNQTSKISILFKRIPFKTFSHLKFSFSHTLFCVIF